MGNNPVSDYYNAKYFLWQEKIGELGGKIDVFKFMPFIDLNDCVIDFGCGGGYILGQIKCARKIGIEVNVTAAKIAERNGLEVFSDLVNVPVGIADVIISHHSLEHVTDPYDKLQALLPLLKPKGKLIVVVPNEKRKAWKPNDVNQHLYTWTAMNLGNLATAAGYKVVSSTEVIHRWPPFYDRIYKIFGHRLFDIIARFYGLLSNNLSQIRLVAEKP